MAMACLRMRSMFPTTLVAIVTLLMTLPLTLGDELSVTLISEALFGDLGAESKGDVAQAEP